MKKKLLILGAGGHGKCCLDIAREMNCYDVICFLDDNAVGSVVNGAEVIDHISNLEKYYGKFQSVFPAIGNNVIRKELMTRAKNLGYEIPLLVSNKSYVSEYAHVGEGTVMFPCSVIESNASVGSGCIITANTTISHDAVVCDFSLIYSNSAVRANATVGMLSRIGSGCVIRFGMTVEAGSDILDGTIV